jgi:hypothetical protein
MRQLEGQDKMRLVAAEGWLQLGNYLEANEELENIIPQIRGHPDVLALRVLIYEAPRNGIMQRRSPMRSLSLYRIARSAGFAVNMAERDLFHSRRRKERLHLTEWLPKCRYKLPGTAGLRSSFRLIKSQLAVQKSTHIRQRLAYGPRLT